MIDGNQNLKNVLVTGATGFVGRYVVRELLSRGLTPVCLVRSYDKLIEQHEGVNPDRIVAVTGSLHDQDALAQAAAISQGAIHLVGIIIERPLRRRTFDSVHCRGTERVIKAVKSANITRYVHMSALGSRHDAASAYHRTKWAGEELVRASGLDWTILRPSLIHGLEGDFMRLMKRLICGLVPPVVPQFGTGEAKIQPVSVEDVAFCCVEALFREGAAGGTFDLGGPKVYSWNELYQTCRRLMPGALRHKPIVSLPVSLAKWIATLTGPPTAMVELLVPSIGMFRFDTGQVLMSQEDNTCDHTKAESVFDRKMADFEEGLVRYAGFIV